MSMQAAGGRISAPAHPSYPFRVVVAICHDATGLWAPFAIWEMESESEALASGADMALDLMDDPNFSDVHYIVGEVANG